MTHHDQLQKDLLRTFFADFLQLVEPRAATRLDLSTVTFLDKETFTGWPEGERRELDLLASTMTAGGGEPVLVHVEIEARARSGMARRLRRYFSQLLSRHDCPILSILVFLQGGPPGVSVESLDYVVLDEPRGRFDYTAFGLAGCRPEDYLQRPEPLAWALSALMRRTRMTRVERKLACGARIATARLSELQRFLLVNCVETYLQLDPREGAEYAALLRLPRHREVLSMKRTWAEQMEANGARQILLQLLGQRFGPVPDDVRKRLEAIGSLERLSRLAKRVLVASSFEELGLA